MRLFNFFRNWSELVAVTWLLIVIGGTLVFGPYLGLRGWIWLGLHDLLCLVGVSWEARQAWKRYQIRLESAPGRRITP